MAKVASRWYLEEYVGRFVSGTSHNRDLVDKVYWRLVELHADLRKRIARDFVTMAALALAFELLNRRLITDATTNGIKFGKLDFARYLIPVLVALLYYRTSNAIREQTTIYHVCNDIAARVYKPLHESKLDMLLLSEAAVTSNLNTTQFLRSWRTTSAHLMALFEVSVFGVLIPLGFSCYAILQLFRSSNPPYGAAWLATVVTVVLVVIGLISVVTQPNTKPRNKP